MAVLDKSPFGRDSQSTPNLRESKQETQSRNPQGVHKLFPEQQKNTPDSLEIEASSSYHRSRRKKREQTVLGTESNPKLCRDCHSY
jgi:hypothetical protein